MSFFKTPFELLAINRSMNKSQAIIEFDTKGFIKDANSNFLSLMNYKLDEIKGKHHSIFIEEKEVNSASYKKFWKDLGEGKFLSSEFKRIGKDKKEVWIEASYNPILGITNKPYKIIKYATDITYKKLEAADVKGQLNALHTSQAVISFQLDGTILDANENFLKTFEYTLEEIKGKHHSIFIEESFKNSKDYKTFWEELNRGIFKSAEFKRFGKNNKEVWIQSVYNPILDMNGKVFKVVKFATDITQLVHERIHRKKIQSYINQDINDINTEVFTTTEKTVSASKASFVTSSKVQEIAAGAEELDASVMEIKNQVENAKYISKTAFEQSNETRTTISSLSKASEKIGEIINLINEIATQTNLLSLNASIEAARAGESGRGFAIVASEVKNLADQTSIATKEISSQVKSVQNFTQKAVGDMEEIFSSIKTLSEISSVISSAVEEQSLVTKEMAINMTMAAEKVETINSSISNISEATSRIKEVAKKVKEASNSIV